MWEENKGNPHGRGTEREGLSEQSLIFFLSYWIEVVIFMLGRIIERNRERGLSLRQS